MKDKRNAEQTHELVKQAYGKVAASQSSCCGPASSCCSPGPAAANQPVPEAELGLSCGNPADFAQFRAGETVVDLGSGAGRDVFLAARAVGPAGRAIGVDMTPEMLALARKNAGIFESMYGLANVEFREGQIESLPLEDASVDVVLSNCVINLSPDKQRVFREVARVLRPGGRMVVSDIVLNRELPPQLRDSAGLYAACIAGALLRQDYLAAVADAGLADVEVLSDTGYAVGQSEGDPLTGGLEAELAGCAASITVRAGKPEGA